MFNILKVIVSFIKSGETTLSMKDLMLMGIRKVMESLFISLGKFSKDFGKKENIMEPDH